MEVQKRILLLLLLLDFETGPYNVIQFCSRALHLPDSLPESWNLQTHITTPNSTCACVCVCDVCVYKCMYENVDVCDYRSEVKGQN